MMRANWLGTTIVVTCDSGCGLCWVYDSHVATFKAAATAAARVGWTFTRTPAGRRDLCRNCSTPTAAPAAPSSDVQPAAHATASQ
jgi:hypothetical protein